MNRAAAEGIKNTI